jgi:hypothetical protein
MHDFFNGNSCEAGGKYPQGAAHKNATARSCQFQRSNKSNEDYALEKRLCRKRRSLKNEILLKLVTIVVDLGLYVID